MDQLPETRYARAPDGTCIAFQVFGSGSVDVLLMPGYFTNVDENWRLPEIADVLRRLGAFARVIVMDRRGVGLSDRMAPGQGAPLETHVDDLVAVLDAAKARDICLVSSETATALAVLFAAAHPERVRALALYMPFCASEVAAGLSDGETWNREVEEVLLGWGDRYAREDLEEFAPSVAGDTAKIRAWGAYLRSAGSPGSALAIFQQWSTMDVRDLLPVVRTPTVVLMRRGVIPERWEPGVAETADRIPGARLVELEGRDFPFWFGDRAAFVAELEGFFTGTRVSVTDPHRSLATVLFTDIVGSTERAAGLGDTAWKQLLGRHDELARREIDGHRGRYVHTTGDGLLATFDGPARAVRCAQAIAHAVQILGLEIRAGCHTGEIEIANDDIQGIAVHIGARVAAQAGPSEVWTSSTVKDLTAGSGLVFEDAGEHELKGVPDRWHLYRVVA